jgi:hypothetical protein
MNAREPRALHPAPAVPPTKRTVGYSWFKVETGCLQSPEVIRLARALRIPRAHALGIVVAVEAMLTSHTPDGDLYQIADLLAESLGVAPDDEERWVSAVLDCMSRGDGIAHAFLERNQSAFESATKARQRAAKQALKGRPTTAQAGTNGASPLAPRFAEPADMPF